MLWHPRADEVSPAIKLPPVIGRRGKIKSLDVGQVLHQTLPERLVYERS
jgi:hypothetical protein